MSPPLFKRFKLFLILFISMLVISFNNCSPMSKPFTLENGIASLEALDEKPLFLINAIVPKDYDIIMYTHRAYFAEALVIHWQLQLQSASGTGSCSILEYPSGVKQDSVRFSCNDVGELIVKIIAEFDHDNNPNTALVATQHERRLYITNNILVGVNEVNVFPNGRSIPPSNIEGGGGSSPPLVEEELIVANGETLYEGICAQCHTAGSRNAIIQAAVNGGANAFDFFDNTLNSTVPMSQNQVIKDLNGSQREALLAYILEQPTPAQLAQIQQGQSFFNNICVGCHTAASRSTRIKDQVALGADAFTFLDSTLTNTPPMSNVTAVQNLNQTDRQAVLAYLLSL